MTPEQKKDILDTLNDLAADAESLVGLSFVKYMMWVLDPTRYRKVPSLDSIVDHTTNPLVRACLELLLAMGGDFDEIEDWLHDYQPERRGWKNTELVRLRRAKPDEWAERIVSELRAHDGNKAATAAALRVSLRTMFRWMSDPAVAGRMSNPLEPTKEAT